MSNRSGHATMPSLSSSISSCSSTSTSSIKPPIKIRKPSKQVSFLEQPIVIYETCHCYDPPASHDPAAPLAFSDFGFSCQAVLDSAEVNEACSSAWWDLAVDLADDGPVQPKDEPWYRRKNKLFSRPSWLRSISTPSVMPSLLRSKKKNNHASTPTASCRHRSRFVQISNAFKQIIQ